MKKLIVLLTTLTFTILAFAAPVAAVSLSWDPNSESDLAGYNIYWGTNGMTSLTNKINVGLTTSRVISNTNFVYMRTNTFVVTAYNTSGLESAFSNSVFFVLTNTTNPSVVRSLKILSITP